ncbi:MAG: STAS domain-containing protein [Holophagales bacterium]|nr:STAS domain-containing protein [Holophagales bacterium]
MAEFEFDAGETRLLCRFDGRMDGAASAQLQTEVEERLAPLLAAHPEKLSVTFDVEKVTFVSSAYLRICMSVAQRVGSGRFSVRGTNPALKKIFLVAGLDNAFQVG